MAAETGGSGGEKRNGRMQEIFGGKVDRTGCDWVWPVKRRKEPGMGLPWASGGAVEPRAESVVPPWAQWPFL